MSHRYYTKILMPREAAMAEEEQAAGAVAGGAVGRKDAVSSAAGPSPAGRQGMPQPRLMRLTASKKKVLDS